MDEIKNNAALEAEQTTALAQEESLILKFRRPIRLRARNIPSWICPGWRM